MSLALKTQALTVAFDTPAGPLAALGPLTIEVDAGAFVCLIGPSGCGKSTLARVFAGLQPPTTGAALIGERRIEKPSSKVGLMFQQANLMPWRTVLENIALPLELAGIPKDERVMRAQALLPLLNLDGFGTAYPAALSGGMAQRAALGRVLIQQPQVLLLDEPFGALDALTREQISVDVLRVWEQQRQTVLMVTHDINEAVLLADRILVMSQRPGRIVRDVHVDLPRPRSLEQVYDPVFVALARMVRAAIQ